MARFRGTIQGSRTETSRLGTALSGLRATVRGWEEGIEVVAYAKDGQDIFDIYKTGGSNSRGRPVLICQVINNIVHYKVD